jgi:glycosyltransferase involved in cell wall biosynthesis
MPPKLTIITPVYNSIAFIEKCINNVIEQNCGDAVEHLIMDAGSTDGTLDVIKSYTDKYSHIRYVSEPDKGQSDAMNKGINLAKGEIISFLNADDLYSVFVLKRVLQLFTNTSLYFAVGNCRLVNDQYETMYINRPARLQAYHFFTEKLPFPINPCAYFYKKEVHNHSEVGFYNVENHFNMDYEFLLKCVLHYPMTYFNEDWGIMLEHANAKTSQDKSTNDLMIRRNALFSEVNKQIPFALKLKSFMYKLIKC